MMKEYQAELFYITDPLCSWCYGFANEVSQIKSDLPENVDFKMIMGGLRPYTTESLDPEMQTFIRGHWEHVQEASGQPFKYDLLDQPTEFVYDTEPPARAAVTMRSLKPEAEFAFFKQIQEIFYRENRNTNDVEAYYSILPEGITADHFKGEFESTAMKQAVRNDFSFAAELGVRGFPSLVLHKGDDWFLVANGYAKSEQITALIAEALAR